MKTWEFYNNKTYTQQEARRMDYELDILHNLITNIYSDDKWFSMIKETLDNIEEMKNSQQDIRDSNDYKTLLWLDDIRNPFRMNWIADYAPEFLNRENRIVWVKNYGEFVRWIHYNNCLPDKIAFDHDLGGKYSGMDCAKWLVDYCIDHELELPEWVIQCSNPVDVENIDGLLMNFKEKYK